MSFLLRNKEPKEAPVIASSEVSEGLVHYYQCMRSNVNNSQYFRMGIAWHPEGYKLV
jgi:hypothetical protein